MHRGTAMRATAAQYRAAVAMSRRRRAVIGRAILAAAALAGAIAASGSLSAQTPGPAVAGAAPALSAADYIEIRQLVARYAYAVDTGAEDGAVYASLFAPDGAFVDRAGRETRGREALIALARRNMRGRQSAFHHIVNHVIEPSPDGGATGRQYLLQLRVGDPERPSDIFGGGHYRDRYVKTPDGWRFLSRQYIPSEGTPASLRRGAK
jgi:hypothetical protein